MKLFCSVLLTVLCSLLVVDDATAQQQQQRASSSSSSDDLAGHHRHHDHPRRPREIWAWAAARPGVAEQLRNATWAALLDGIQLSGAFLIQNERLILNETLWQKTRPLAKTAMETNTKIQLWIHGNVPESAIQDPTQIIQDAIAIYERLKSEGIHVDGFSWDDEQDCAPRANVTAFTAWMNFSNQFTIAMRLHGLRVSSAVQAVFGIQETGDPCAQVPSNYPLQPDVVNLLQGSVMDTWLVMDTYYYTTGRFLTTLDWHAAHIPSHSLGIGMMNRDDLSTGDWVARFYALHHYGDKIHHLNLFWMPIDDNFLPFLQRWKTYCRGCGKQTMLGCFDMDIDCDDGLYKNDEEMVTDTIKS